MLNEIAGYVWWEYENEIEPNPDACHVFIEAGKSVYRCSSSDRVWRKVEVILNSDRTVFHSPLYSIISRCITGQDGTLYILFTDGTAIDMLTPPRNGWITICGEVAGFLSKERVRGILTANPDLSDTPIYTETDGSPLGAIASTDVRSPERRYYPLFGTLIDNQHLSIPWSCISVDGERQDGIEEITPNHPQYATWYQALQEKEQRFTEHEEETRRARAKRRAKRQTNERS